MLSKLGNIMEAMDERVIFFTIRLPSPNFWR